MQQQQYEPSLGYVICLKKKRVGGEVLGYKNGRTDNSGERSPIKGRSFRGLNRGNNIDLYGQRGGFNARAVRSAFYANHSQNLIKVCFLLAFCPSVLGSKLEMYAGPELTNKKDSKIAIISMLSIGGCSLIVLIIAICIMCYRSTKQLRQITPEPEDVAV